MHSPHLLQLVERCPTLGGLLPDIIAAFEMQRDCIRAGGKLLLCGNGGSASDADHWSGELLKGFQSKRPLTQEEQARLPEQLAKHLQGGLPAIPLGAFVALNTAFANDVDASLCYAQLVWALGKPGDVLIGISTSGNARNVIAAMQAARARGMRVLGLSGETGGAMKKECDLCLCMPSTETYRIQEFHLPVYHCLSLMLEEEFFPA
jgi:D-sedoheptulose 7-phosphate isomerase